MHPRLDPQSPVPLYHQLAEALRYQIATGALTPGTVLPPLRRAAAEWGVNLHTVRHAYAVLAEQRLVRTQAPTGTVVLASAGAAPRADAVEAFVRGVLQAAAGYGLSPAELQRRLAAAAGGAEAEAGPVHVVECSETQSEDLARQLAAAWRVRARGWSLERSGEPPPGPVVATYFHYNDIRTRWPERFAQVHFASIRPDPALLDQLRPFERSHAATSVLLCEREENMARNIAADLAAVLPPERFTLRTVVAARPGEALAAAAPDQPVLFAPRVWGALTPAERADPRALEVRYLFDAHDLAALGDRVGG
ncbi:MAG TPA: GntR family transcriptional regulator [Longimicrobiaceae bacterium]|nr:GntR family transcriptional regulator [Longimicrobiaceae bacterium]